MVLDTFVSKIICRCFSCSSVELSGLSSTMKVVFEEGFNGKQLKKQWVFYGQKLFRFGMKSTLGPVITRYLNNYVVTHKDSACHKYLYFSSFPPAIADTFYVSLYVNTFDLVGPCNSAGRALN